MLNLVEETNSILKEACPEFDFEVFAEECDPVICTPFESLRNIVNDMFEIMYANNGIGLATPQVGLNYRFFIMKADKEEFICINPRIIEKSSKDELSEEGCLSFPGLRLKVTRPENISVIYQDINGSETTRTFTGLASRCFQHELDHLNGITFDSKVSKLILRMARDKRSKLLKKQQREGS